MAYGQKKAPKSLEEYSVVDKLGLGVASAVGIAVATFVDLTQADDASALFVFNKWLTSFTGMLEIGNPPLYAVVLILMAIGGLSVTYFQPVTLRGAFATGFASLAVLMNLAPAELGEPLPGTGGDMPTGDFVDDLPPAGDGGDVMLEDISFSLPRSSASLAVSSTFVQTAAEGYNVRIKINFPEGLEQDVTTMVRRGTLRGRLHNESTNATYNLFRNSGAELDYRNNTLYLATKLPGKAPMTRLVARVEAEGYCIQEESFQAAKGANPIWEIDMVSGCMPLVIQRLNRPYTF